MLCIGLGLAAGSAIPTEPVSSALFDQADLQNATSFFLPEIQFGAIQAARGRIFGPHDAVDGSGTELALPASCTVPGDPTDQDGDGIPHNFTTTFDCLEAPLLVTPIVGSWTVTDLNDTDPQSGYIVSGEEMRTVDVYESSTQMAHAFRFEMTSALGATYAADFNYRRHFSRAATAEMYEQRRRLNLRVLKEPDTDGQGMTLILSGETSIADDLTLAHPHGAAQIRGELHYSASCGASGGIDAGSLSFSSGTVTLPTQGTASSTQTATSVSIAGSADGLSLNLGYSSTTTTITSSSTTAPALAALLRQIASKIPEATVTVTYTGCGHHS
jgi:hypothetical protein